MTKISDQNSITLSSIEACTKSIRANHKDVSKDQWDKLNQIYYQLYKLQQNIVFPPRSKQYEADAVTRELVSVQPMSPKLGKHFKDSFDVVLGKGWEKKSIIIQLEHGQAKEGEAQRDIAWVINTVFMGLNG